ncbi:HrpB1 family type III secretion system apparatus protein [Bremerella sp. JC770]|uniref:tetratricopeptide repeat protein n=1 Tax=Bremerella sp. JC770 TaxID=3232137 RepID=UPI0034579693
MHIEDDITIEIPTSLAKQVLEIGLMAAWQGQTVEARTILNGLKSVRPDASAIEIGIAVSYLNEGRVESAIRVLEKAREAFSECDQTRFYLALAYKLSGLESSCQSICQEISANQADEIAVALSQSLQGVPPVYRSSLEVMP